LIGTKNNKTETIGGLAAPAWSLSLPRDNLFARLSNQTMLFGFFILAQAKRKGNRKNQKLKDEIL
jgi:hypothetical protein